MTMSERTRVSRLDKVFDGCGRRRAFVGLDVHKRTINAAVWLDGRIVAAWVMPANADKVAGMLAPHRAKIARVVYEAGPTGFGLARVLRRARLGVEVVAPGRTPRASARQNKSDRLDCAKLAEYAAKGLLKPVAVPSETQEADRQLVRLRDQLVKKRRTVKQQIRSFLLQHAIAEPGGLNSWSLAARAALREQALGAQLRLCLDVLLDLLDELEAHVRRTERAISALAATERHAEAAAIARSHPGVGTVVAMSYLVEVHRGGRFREPREVASYVGLAPMVRQSGQTRLDGPIVRTGRASMRALLVEAAWRWRMRDPAARRLFARLLRNTGSAKKAIVALARHLAINLWAMLTRREPYRAAA
jgi:transposase